MRFYNLVLSDPTSRQVYQPSANGLGFVLGPMGYTFSSWVKGPNGQMWTDMGALNVEFDFPIYAYHQSQGKQWIRIYGIGLPMIGQASNLNGANVTLTAGMKPGLPLATAAASQMGIMLQGVVFQAFGNWQGTNQTLELVVNPGASEPTDILWNWSANTQMSDAIALTLKQAFPKYKANINIGSSLVLPNAEPGHYNDLMAFATYLNRISLKAGTPVYGDKYPGVQVTVTGTTIYVFDTKGPTPPVVFQLAFQDLIGQPTWINATQVSFNTVLRSDISVGMVVQFPKGIASPYALTSVGAAVPNAPVSSKTAFQGGFYVKEVHHFANFRQGDGESWTTAFVGSSIVPTAVFEKLPTGTAYLESAPGFDAS